MQHELPNSLFRMALCLFVLQGIAGFAAIACQSQPAPPTLNSKSPSATRNPGPIQDLPSTPTHTRTLQTPSPTATYTTSPTPSLTSLSIFPNPYKATFRFDPSLFFSTNLAEQTLSKEKVRKQIRACLDPLSKNHAAKVSVTGYNPGVSNAFRLAQSAMQIIIEEFKVAFEGTEAESSAIRSDDPSLNGRVDLEILYFNPFQISTTPLPYGNPCLPPPETWCQGSGDGILIIANWDRPILRIVIDGKPYDIPQASGIAGDSRTIGCILLPFGPHGLQAESFDQNISINHGKEESLAFCLVNRELGLCPPGNPPSTGVRVRPTNTAIR